MKRHVLSKKAPEVILVEDDHPIQEFPPTTADPAFRDPILPGAAVCGASGLDVQGSHCLHYLACEDRISVDTR